MPLTYFEIQLKVYFYSAWRPNTTFTVDYVTVLAVFTRVMCITFLRSHVQ